MSTIKLQSEMDSHFTTVPHRFIDLYMPSANGEFVKVYLYLLRSLHGPDGELSLSLLADRLFCTEKDIMRALGYWEKQGILSLSRNDDGQPTGIVLREADAETDPEPVRAYPKASPGLLPDAERQEETTPQEKDRKDPSVPQFTRDQLERLKQDEDFSQLLFLTEMYLGKTLNSTEINSLCYYYDTLKFPVELIEYLVESCVSKGHKSFHYIEAVAQRWHSAGIRTVQEAKEQSSQYTKQYYSVLRAFGITDRSPVEQEIHMIDHWMNDFGFSTELICEACSRTISHIGKSSFSYADSILTNWKKQKVHNLKDLEAVDARHTGTKAPKNAGGEKKASANNRFNNFNQREYDYRELEQQLLKKQ
jgi:DnaD/phage-associated family protein